MLQYQNMEKMAGIYKVEIRVIAVCQSL